MIVSARKSAKISTFRASLFELASALNRSNYRDANSTAESWSVKGVAKELDQNQNCFIY